MQKYSIKYLPLVTFSIVILLFSCKNKEPQTAIDNVSNDFKFASPEGIVSDGHFFYVSNIGRNITPTVRDNDGFILKLDGDMNVIEKFSAATRLNAPKGMGIINDKLLVNDIDRIVFFSLETGRVLDIINIDIDSNAFLNDIAIKDDSTAYVSDPMENKIFEVNLKTKKYSELNIVSLKGPNGLFYCNRKNRLWVVETGEKEKADGRIIVIYPDEKRYDIIDGFTGRFDGIKLLINDDLLISDWATNNIYHLNLGSGNLTKITLEAIDTPGDFLYNDSTRTLYSTKIKDNDVVKVQVEDTIEK